MEVTPADEVVCRLPDGTEQGIAFADLASVYVETNNTDPWDTDVWWVLKDGTGATRVAFPQLATGEAAVLHRLHELDGFEVRGMNSGENARLLCWSTPAQAEAPTAKPPA